MSRRTNNQYSKPPKHYGALISSIIAGHRTMRLTYFVKPLSTTAGESAFLDTSAPAHQFMTTNLPSTVDPFHLGDVGGP